MSVLVSLPLASGASLTVEADDDRSSAGMTRAAKPGEIVATVGQTLEDALDTTLVPVAEAIVERLQTIAPSEAEVTLGLKLSAEVGVIVSKVAGEATLQVKLTWRRDAAPAGETPAAERAHGG
jgi:hypothetical protein